MAERRQTGPARSSAMIVTHNELMMKGYIPKEPDNGFQLFENRMLINGCSLSRGSDFRYNPTARSIGNSRAKMSAVSIQVVCNLLRSARVIL
jgi:hypothetical protein